MQIALCVRSTWLLHIESIVILNTVYKIVNRILNKKTIMYNTRKCEFTIELFDLLTILNVNFQNKHVLKKN